MIPKNSQLIPLGDIPYYITPEGTVYKCTGKEMVTQGGRYRLRVEGRYQTYTPRYLMLLTKEIQHGNQET